jgi:hypothetical protein
LSEANFTLRINDAVGIILIVNALLIFAVGQPHTIPQADPSGDIRWAVQVTGRDRRPKKGPNCHALEYFSDPTHLKSFDYTYSFPQPYPDGIADDVQVHRRGEIQGFAIYDVVHKIDSSDAPDNREKFSYPPGLIKMTIAERRPDEFCEIYHAQDSNGDFVASPSYFVDVGAERVLAAHDPVAGVGHYFFEAYWTFDKDGPMPLDLGIIKQTVDKLLPPNVHIYRGLGFQIETLEYDMGTLQDSDGPCCPQRGRVHLRFTLKNHKLILITQQFIPTE